MKNTVKFFGIIAFVAVIGFSMTACEPETPDRLKDLEFFEATTNGRLTITGLSNYNGQEIQAGASTASDLDIYAFERATNSYDPNEDDSNTHETYFATVANGQAVMKVFVNNTLQSGKSGGWQNYNGNDQNVIFAVTIGNLSAGGTLTVNGTVTVNFTNGVATGAFVLNDW